jgi:ATPase subunit of ABC transporter with duplicated ATPase domains
MIDTSSTRSVRTWPTWITARSPSIRVTTTTSWKPRHRPAQRQQSANAKAKERIAELQNFVRRFSANASKAKQATSRLKLIDKLKPEDVKPSSRQYPWIRFEFDEKEKLHRQAVEIQNLSFGYHDSERKIFNKLDLTLNGGDRLAIIGENGVGKTTLLKLLMGELSPAARQHQMGGKSPPRLLCAGPRQRIQQRPQPDRLDRRLRTQQRRRRR